MDADSDSLREMQRFERRTLARINELSDLPTEFLTSDERDDVVYELKQIRNDPMTKSIWRNWASCNFNRALIESVERGSLPK